MQALVINMKNSPDRWDFMVRQLEGLGVSYSRLEASDVSNLSEEIFERFAQSWERPLRKSEVGCFLSHKSAWQKVARENKPYLVLEDDVILCKETLEILNHFEAKSYYELINLETSNRLKLIGNYYNKIDDKFSLTRLFHNKTGSGAYIIWPSFAKKLLEKYTNKKAALADAALFTNFFKCKQYQLIPAIAVQLQYAEFFGIKNTFSTKSNISFNAKEKSVMYKFLIRRITMQILIIFVSLINSFRAKRKKIELA